MNALYTHALKQKSQLQQDLAKFEKNPNTVPISLQGSISATLVAFEKTITQYNEHLTIFQQNNDKSQEHSDQNVKFQQRLDNLKANLAQYKNKFKDLKLKYNQEQELKKKQLFGDSNNNGTTATTTASSSSNPFDDQLSKRHNYQRTNTTNNRNNDPNNLDMFDGLRKERGIFQRGNLQLDMLLEMGQQSLDDIIEQNKILHSMQDKMTNSLRTLNVSEQTIQNINKRLFKDKLIFWIALFLLFLGMYLVLKYLR